MIERIGAKNEARILGNNFIKRFLSITNDDPGKKLVICFMQLSKLLVFL
jgi:hypothetical protein